MQIWDAKSCHRTGTTLSQEPLSWHCIKFQPKTQQFLAQQLREYTNEVLPVYSWIIISTYPFENYFESGMKEYLSAEIVRQSLLHMLPKPYLHIIILPKSSA